MRQANTNTRTGRPRRFTHNTNQTNVAKATSRKDAIMTRHVLPLDEETVGRIARSHLPIETRPNAVPTAASLEWYVVASGCATLGGDRMREIANGARMHRDGEAVIVLTAVTKNRRLTYADIDGLAGAVLAELTKLWKCSREDAVARCVPKTEAGVQMLADGIANAQICAEVA